MPAARGPGPPRDGPVHVRTSALGPRRTDLDRACRQGDGDLTDDERRTLDACPNAHLMTIPGSVFMPNEAPDQIADVIAEAAGQVG